MLTDFLTEAWTDFGRKRCLWRIFGRNLLLSNKYWSKWTFRSTRHYHWRTNFDWRTTDQNYLDGKFWRIDSLVVHIVLWAVFPSRQPTCSTLQMSPPLTFSLPYFLFLSPGLWLLLQCSLSWMRWVVIQGVKVSLDFRLKTRNKIKFLVFLFLRGDFPGQKRPH